MPCIDFTLAPLLTKIATSSQKTCCTVLAWRPKPAERKSVFLPDDCRITPHYSECHEKDIFRLDRSSRNGTRNPLNLHWWRWLMPSLVEYFEYGRGFPSPEIRTPVPQYALQLQSMLREVRLKASSSHTHELTAYAPNTTFGSTPQIQGLANGLQNE